MTHSSLWWRILQINYDTAPTLTRFLARQCRRVAIFALIWSSLFNLYTSARNGSATSGRVLQSGTLRWACRTLSKSLNCLYVIWLFKWTIMLALDCDSLASYRYLDCYLLGRLSINARSSGGARYVSIVVALNFLLYRSLVARIRTRNFRFQALDFTLQQAPIVRATSHRLDFTCHRMLHKNPRMAREKPTGYRLHFKRLPVNQVNFTDDYYDKLDQLVTMARGSSIGAGSGRPRTGSEQENLELELDEISFARSSFAASNFVILKLNRTTKIWFWQQVITLIWSVYCVIVFLAGLVALLAVMTPTVLTRRGFEATYHNCVSYIRENNDNQNNNQNNTNNTNSSLWFDGIYKPRPSDPYSSCSDLKLPLFLPMQDLTSGGYHLVRIAFDYFEALVILLDVACLFGSNIILLVILISDTLINAELIRNRLECLRWNLWHELHEPDAGVREQNRIVETIHLQALLLDHFQTITRYNEYVSPYCLFCITCWLTTSATILLWLGVSGSVESINMEFPVAQAATTFLIFTFFLVLSLVKQCNRKFYPLISSLMALDNVYSMTKQRWMNILDYFQPTPMYCFTIIKTEISYLLMLKSISGIWKMPTGSERDSFKERAVRRFVKASIVFSFTYFIFIKSLARTRSPSFRRDATLETTNTRRHQHRKRRSGVLEEFEQLSSLVRVYYAIMELIFGLFIVQSFVMCLLDLDSFRNFRHLDCLLLGRVSLDGRFSRFAKYLMLLFSTFQFTWLITMRHFEPHFNLKSLIFLLHPAAQVAAHASECSPTSGHEGGYANRKLDHQQRQHPLIDAMFLRQLDQKDRLIQVRSFNDRALFRLTKRNDAQAGSGELQQQAETTATNHLLRPTRTAEAHRQLVRLTWIYLATMGVVVCISLPLGVRVALPMHLTQTGFELNYVNCVDYLLNHPHHFRFVNIRQVHQIMFTSLRRSVLPLEDFRWPVTHYELTRWFVDLGVALAFWFLMVIAFVSDTYLAVIIASDTFNYSRVVRSRVARLMGELNSLRLIKLTTRTTHELEQQNLEHLDEPEVLELLDGGDYEMIAGSLISTGTRGTRATKWTRGAEGVGMRVVASEQKLISSCSLITQTLIVDLFQLIECQNAYVSLYLLYVILFWLAFSFVDILLVMTLNSRGHIGKAQIYVIQLGATCYFITICCLFTHTRRLIIHTYEKLATIMALDNSSDGTKERWCSILRYFYPIPLYCFSMFRSNEISWLFMMKLVAWIGSAFLVMLNFQRVYQVVDVPFSGVLQ